MWVLERALKMYQCLLVTLVEGSYSDTDRHHYTLSCFYSPSMKCHSVSFRFALAVLSPFSCTSVCLTLLSHYLLLSISPYLSSSPCLLTLSVLLFHFLYSIWYLSQMTLQLICSGMVSLFYWYGAYAPVKTSRHCPQTALLKWWCLQVTI